MARTAAGAALTRQHRQQQLALRAATLRDFARLWPLWQFGDRDSYAGMVVATTTLVQARHRDSAGLAVRYFQAFRVAEQVGGDAAVRLAERIAPTRVAAALDVTGRAGVMRAVRAGFSPQAAARNGFVRASGAVGRLTLDGSRETLVESSRADRQAAGRWQRVTAAEPCDFCALTASRGAVYSEETVDFEAHDHCACSVEPAYPGTEMPPASQRFRELWDAEASGLPPDEARRAFRRALGNN